jgi:alkylation response protein AidB-like acyl-CoA dehydrogenase
MTQRHPDPRPNPQPNALPDLAEYHRQARAWVTANLEPGPHQPRAAFKDGGQDRTEADIATQRRLQRRLHEAGYAGITWPAEYGGQGLPREYQQAFDTAARGYRLPDFGVAGGTTFGVCAPTMLAHGSPALLRRHIPRILAGDELVVQFFSDPEAGSDLAGVRTRATRRDGGWLLNGSKIWSSGAHYADYGLCLARTDWDVPKHRGLTWFAVPVRAEGVTVQRIRQINGNAEFCQEFFDDVELTDGDVVGEVGDGWTVAQTMLLFERGGSAVARRPGGSDARRIAPDLMRLAESLGRLDDPRARELIARAHTDDVARDHLTARIGGLIRADPATASGVASYFKLASGVFDPIRANLALELSDGAAATWHDPQSPAARAAVGLLNSRFMAIAGGTTQMQRNSIGERVLGLPREPTFDSTKPFRDVLRDARNWSGRVG